MLRHENMNRKKLSKDPTASLLFKSPESVDFIKITPVLSVNIFYRRNIKRTPKFTFCK